MTQIDGRAVRADLPDPGLVVGHVQVAVRVEHEVVPHREHPVAGQAAGRGHLREDLGRGVLPARVEAQDPAVHVGHVELVVRALVAIEGEPEQTHVGVRCRVDDGRVDEVAVAVVGEHPLVVRVLVSREEVAGAGRDIDAVVAVDGDPEWVPGRRCAGEDGDVTERRMAVVRGENAAARGERGDREDRRPLPP